MMAYFGENIRPMTQSRYAFQGLKPAKSVADTQKLYRRMSTS